MPSRDWDAVFARMASSPSQTEQEKIEAAERAVQRAIDSSTALTGRTLKVFAQGSYRNRTNVRADSDVDVCVRCADTIFFDAPPFFTPAGHGPVVYPFDQFRTDVGAALTAHFGARSVRAGRKAFDIHENTYRIAADVVPTLLYRQYRFGLPPIEGTGFLSAGQRIINFPDQHYDNGIAKNKATGRRFKGVTRILKSLRYEMLDNGIPSAAGVQSYELECMVWNAPTPLFGMTMPFLGIYAETGIRQPLKAILEHLYAGTASDQACAAWKEVNDIKPLFGAGQPWTREGARSFIADVWAYAELGQ